MEHEATKYEVITVQNCEICQTPLKYMINHTFYGVLRIIRDEPIVSCRRDHKFRHCICEIFGIAFNTAYPFFKLYNDFIDVLEWDLKHVKTFIMENPGKLSAQYCRFFIWYIDYFCDVIRFVISNMHDKSFKFNMIGKSKYGPDNYDVFPILDAYRAYFDDYLTHMPIAAKL